MNTDYLLDAKPGKANRLLHGFSVTAFLVAPFLRFVLSEGTRCNFSEGTQKCLPLIELISEARCSVEQSLTPFGGIHMGRGFSQTLITDMWQSMSGKPSIFPYQFAFRPLFTSFLHTTTIRTIAHLFIGNNTYMIFLEFEEIPDFHAKSSSSSLTRL
jgi:hypothetical protein